uniref:C-type lectin domain-containing protein n=1 Tax=Anas platyrhynchos TaxID=8839 RepID=A0A8B9THK2_ANAPL
TPNTQDLTPNPAGGWTYFEGSCYFRSATPSTWETARGFCSALGTRLLEVDSPEERTFLRASSWLGITDKEVEGTWKRADGTVLSWHRDEPNGGQQENCAVVRVDGTWFDYPCTSHPVGFWGGSGSGGGSGLQLPAALPAASQEFAPRMAPPPLQAPPR